MSETSANPTDEPDEPDDFGADADEPTRAWVPFVVGTAFVVAVFVAAVVLFRITDSDAAVTLPSDLPTMPATSTTTTAPPVPTTTAPPITTTPTTVVPTITVFPARTTSTTANDDDDNDNDDDGPDTTARRSSDRSTALREYADEIGASEVSDVVTLGSTSYALLVVTGDGQLASWDGDTWDYAERVPTSSSITAVDTDDVTGDGVGDFVVWLSGLARPGGVFSRATFDFDFLPFNTTNGKVDFVDGLTLRLGRLESPYRDANGVRTLDWRWTGRMFEAR